MAAATWLLLSLKVLAPFVASYETEEPNAIPYIFLTVSSHVPLDAEDFASRRLEMNWDTNASYNWDPRSWVGVFERHPQEEGIVPLEVAWVWNHTRGYYLTGLSVPHQELHNLTQGGCLNFYMGYFSNETLLAWTCLRTRPTWMWEMREVLGAQRIADIMLPGTHNAGCYEGPERAISTSRLSKYIMTQDENIQSQLMYGIRYLDLRVAYRRFSSRPAEQFWITHSIFMTNHSVRQVLRNVRDFLSRTREIVILDFHRFERGFDRRSGPTRHAQLINLLLEELDMSLVVPRYLGYHTKLADLWAMDKRLFVTYASPSYKNVSFLFPGVRHLWAQADTVDDLENYFERSACLNHGRYLRSAMAQMTPTPGGLIMDKYKGLRKMAQDVNGLISTWFRERWWNCSNIVSTDFFLGNDLINVAIQSNKKRFSNS